MRIGIRQTVTFTLTAVALLGILQTFDLMHVFKSDRRKAAFRAYARHGVVLSALLATIILRRRAGVSERHPPDSVTTSVCLDTNSPKAWLYSTLPVIIHLGVSKLQTYLEQRAVKVREVDCHRVFLGEPQEVQKALRLEQQPELLPTDAQIHALASDCSHFLHHYGFLMDPLTHVENQFPIAFSILAFQDSSQVVDLLRTVYRPQNFYCLHVDKKSPLDFRLAVESVSRCLPNVFMASRSVDVHWGTYTVLEPEIVCMGDLWRNKAWKYFINLTGQEFPLKTNYELVRILTAFKGANDIPGGIPNKHLATERWRRFLPAPHDITVYKGSTHILASRAFVDFVLHAPQAQDFLQWCQRTGHPAEHYFNSLNRNPHLHAPGRYLGQHNESENYLTTQTSLARYKNWVPKYPCPGKRVVRGICILNVLDLPMLYWRPELFANKFHAGYSRLALRCLAEELHNRTRDQTLGQRHFDVSIYEQFVLNRQTY